MGGGAAAGGGGDEGGGDCPAILTIDQKKVYGKGEEQ
jgi:hypothetical protein